MAHYSASKAGVVSVTRTAAQVLAAHRITSNCICPGVVDTPMWTGIDADWAEIEGWQTGEAWKRRIGGIPLGRPETADDVAGLVSFLASRDFGLHDRPGDQHRRRARHGQLISVRSMTSRCDDAVCDYRVRAPAGQSCSNP